MVELLKQPQYAPYSVEDQIVSIFAGTQGHLDDLAVDEVLAFEAALRRHVHDEFPEVLDELTEKGEMSDELAEKLTKIVKDFKAQYKSSKEE